MFGKARRQLRPFTIVSMMMIFETVNLDCWAPPAEIVRKRSDANGHSAAAVDESEHRHWRKLLKSGR